MKRAVSIFVAVLVATLLLTTLPGAAATRTLKATQECGCSCGNCGSYKLPFGGKNCNCCCWNTGIPGVNDVQVMNAAGANIGNTATEAAVGTAVGVEQAKDNMVAGAVTSTASGVSKAIKKWNPFG